MQAERSHQSFVGVMECPQAVFPGLAGRRLFWVRYSEMDTQDVEMIRQELAGSLKYENTLCLVSGLALLELFSSGMLIMHISAQKPGLSRRPPMEK